MYRVGDIFYWKSKGMSEGVEKVEFVRVEKVTERTVWLKKIRSTCVYREVKHTTEGTPYTEELYIPDTCPELFPIGTFRRIINERCTRDLIASRRKSQKNYERYRGAVEFIDKDWIYK